ncbi:hypothetical protein HYV88_01535 [Candidatus Woesearchaeota archaeon]|nr:hypothetical protein [Candidatus Woesearchaeota archaeon]
MSDLKSHVIFGLVLLIGFIALNSQYHWINFSQENTFNMNPYSVFLLIGLFFTLLPDLDNETSLAHRYFTIIGLILAIYFIVLDKKAISLIILLTLLAIKSMSNIGPFHRLQSLWLHKKSFILIVLAILFIAFPPIIGIASAIGLLGHNLLDSLSTTWRNSFK